jgi:hypothetical protein
MESGCPITSIVTSFINNPVPGLNNPLKTIAGYIVKPISFAVHLKYEFNVVV